MNIVSYLPFIAVTVDQKKIEPVTLKRKKLPLSSLAVYQQLFRLLLQTSGERSFTILWTLLSSCYIYGCSSNGENSIYRCNNTCLCWTGGTRSSEAETMEHRPIRVHQDKFKKIACINLETRHAWKYDSRNSFV